MSLRDREGSITSGKIDDNYWSPMVDDTEEKDLEALGSLNRQPRRYSLNSLALSVPQLHYRKLSSKTYVSEAKTDSESDLVKEIDHFRKIEVIYDEVNTGETSSITEYLHEQPNQSTKITYSLKELHLLNNEQKINFFNTKQVKLSDVLKFDSRVPICVPETIYQSNKSINQIKIDLIEDKELDLATKTISLFLLMMMGYKHTQEKNSNYFLASFNELIEFTTDTGIFFDLLEKSTSDPLREALVQMILNYCWDHWNFGGDKNEYIVQSRITIFRIMCNLKLGISGIENFNVALRNRVEFRVQTLIREITKRSKCNDYLEVIPMIAQAIDLVDTVNLEYLFYDLLLVIVRTHSTCCMDEYLFDPRTDLKAIVQHGFWYKNDRKIIDKANEIFQYLVTVNKQIYKWYSEISGGKIYVASARSSGLLRNQTPEVRPTTPGGWKINRVE